MSESPASSVQTVRVKPVCSTAFRATVLPHGPGEAERLAQLAKDHAYDVLVSNPTFAFRVAEAGARFKFLISRTKSGTDHLKLHLLGEAGADTSKLEPMFRQALGIGMNEMRVVDKLEGGLVVDTRV